MRNLYLSIICAVYSVPLCTDFYSYLHPTPLLDPFTTKFKAWSGRKRKRVEKKFTAEQGEMIAK